MKKLVFIFLCFFAFSAVAEKRTVFTVTDRECQTIDGFGASDAWSMWQIGLWADSVQQQIADWLFSTECDSKGQPKGIGLSIWRFNAGAGSAAQGDSAMINRDTRTEYFSRQIGQRKFLKLAKERGVPTFLAFFNSPPVQLTQNGRGTNTGRDGTFNLRPDAYEDFAKYAANMIEQAEREDGIHFDYLCPVNEPDGHWNWLGPKQEGTPATNREVARIAREMSKEFSERELTTRILVNESSDFRCMMGIYETDWQRGNEIQCFWNPDSTDTYIGNLPNIADVMAGHSYWTNTPVLRPEEAMYDSIGLYGYRKRLAAELAKVERGFWMTELCIMGNDKEIGGGVPYDFSMKTALYVARVIHYDLTVANARSWQWWRAAGGNYRDGLIRMYREGERNWQPGQKRLNNIKNNTARDSRLMWALGNYSRFIRPGAVRLEVTGGDGNPFGIMLSAFRNADGTRVFVIINYSGHQEDITLNGIAKDAELHAYRTSDEEDETLKPIGRVKAAKIELPAKSITTIITPNLK
ncbi:MAG: glycoside hydrolase family 30 protein [Bacteroidaceae bacterium]|nr:glycoside hydrolase family 30 protein [Bacteroidaceae bacterium]